MIASKEVAEKVRELLETLVKSLVDVPDKVAVKYVQGERTTVYEIDCDRSDVGKLLGTKGRNISALRTIVHSIGRKHKFRAIVQLTSDIY